MRRARKQSLKGKGLGQITGAVSIRKRPASAEDRAVYVMLIKVGTKDSETVINALIKQAQELPTELYKSLTWDRGSEMAAHRRFTLATDINVYFCDPQSPWQRGSNENTNRLLRQYLPKGTDLAVHSQAQLNAVARQLNERPRKTLDYETPAERISACVASIG
jgi:IS30 family transposase